MTRGCRIAYFSMEIALDAAIPSYSGGLGVLAGDTLRSAADMGLPMVAVTILTRQGYLTQRLDAEGRQSEDAVKWTPGATLHRLPHTVAVEIEGRQVQVGAWRYDVRGVDGHIVPVLMLDTDVSANSAEDRLITARLYGGDNTYRLKQEAVLGIAGVRMLRAAGHDAIEKYHMNEGHASLLVLELLHAVAKEVGRGPGDAGVAERVRSMCVFTTHTPVEAGHDKFEASVARQVLGGPFLEAYGRLKVGKAGGSRRDVLNMTYLGFDHAGYINAVARRHGEFSRRLFRGYAIDSITNGVHAGTWVCPAMAQLFDRYAAGWRRDPFALRNAGAIPADELRAAHRQAKSALVRQVNAMTGVGFDEGAFTIAFARRATPYKRADMLLRDPARLAAIAAKHGPVQVVYAGKAHPRDEGGKKLIADVNAGLRALGPAVKGVYLANYEMPMGAMLTSGADLWLNTPRPPLEASGTSGMKAAMNGVPSLSTIDGWWVEGWVEGVTGWAIGQDNAEKVDPGVENTPDPAAEVAEVESLYAKLDKAVLPVYFTRPDVWAGIMRSCIAINGSYFHTHRMMLEYATRAYLGACAVGAAASASRSA